MVQPGLCSPSRSVVSKKTIWFEFGIGFALTGRSGSTLNIIMKRYAKGIKYYHF
jgi:hypothetical protein